MGSVAANQIKGEIMNKTLLELNDLKRRLNPVGFKNMGSGLVCPKCDHAVFDVYHFCPNCGQCLKKA